MQWLIDFQRRIAEKVVDAQKLGKSAGLGVGALCCEDGAEDDARLCGRHPSPRPKASQRA